MLILGTLCFRDMTTRPTIAIDIDGVIYDIIAHITDKFLYDTYKGYRPNSWECWNEFGITRDMFFDYYSQCWEEAAISTNTRLEYTDPYANYLFSRLRKLGYRITVITKRANHDIYNTLEYLNRIGVNFDQFVVISDTQDKSKENYNLIIDDYGGNMPSIDSGKLGILVNQSWNKEFEISTNHIRIDDLPSAIPLIQRVLPLPSSSLPS
jgi:FMN phosphatase YigB (HAD superfamily)